MNFADYNDFELLYLVKEGSERAQYILYLKYNIYIKKLAGKYFPYGDKKNDLIQEGLMLLHQSIHSFNSNIPITFYSYLTIILHRKFVALVKRDKYYQHTIFLKDNAPIYGKEETKDYHYLKKAEYFLKDELNIHLFQEHILEGLSLHAFARKYNVSYGKVYARRRVILEELKKLLTNSQK